MGDTASGRKPGQAHGKRLCIHGHFYQPPREDPWLDAVLPEGSAAPHEHWNERICAESYAPLAWARRLDGQGRIIEIVNCYEWMSFNFGPTLLSWMQRQAPDTYARVLEGDAKSLARLGHGNAIAQIHHHVIMPLATDLEKRAEIAWALADFEARFGRRAEGLWLSEAAVDTRTLDLLARAGVRFTILAPRQAKEVADIGADNWSAAHEGNLDIREPYLVELPEGRSIAVYFYDGPLSQAVAFEGLLRHGDAFWGRLSGLAREHGLLALATDGETYGHHFTFGEMALAFALSRAREGAEGVELTNYAAYLAANPPRRRARIHENSSWSCAHGIERWRSDCGCCTEHKPGWNQRWRAPLRDGLRAVKDRLDAHYAKLGAGLFRDAEQAAVDYGRVLAGLEDDDAFAAAHFKKGLSAARRDTAWKLLTMQKWALSSFASCAWFFDDLGRIEPLNALACALRAMDLAARTGCENLEALLLSHIGQARSNDPALGGGAELWAREVLPRRESPQTLVAQALLLLWSWGRLPGPGDEAEVRWPGLAVEVETTGEGPGGRLKGRARIAWARESGADDCAWAWTPPHGPGDPLTAGVDLGGGRACAPAQDLPWGKRQAVALAWVRRAEAEAWAAQLAEAAQGAALFSPYREAQTTQTGAPRWGRFWAALCWGRIVDGTPHVPDLLDFLRGLGAGHPERGLLAERLGQALEDLLRAERPDFNALAGLLARARELDLAPVPWAAQNRFWARLRTAPEGREAAAALGFATD